MNKIVNTGKVYKFDEEGYIINQAKVSKIQDKWLDALNSIIDMYNNHDFFTDNIHSIYVRGSAAVGQAYDNISDLDIIIILKGRVKRSKGQLDILLQAKAMDFFNSLEKYREDNYPFITKIDNGPAIYLNKLLSSDDHLYVLYRFYIKYTATHVYGENIHDSLPAVPKHKVPMYHPALPLHLGHIDAQPVDIRIHGNLMQYTARRIIRSSFELTYNRSNVWTRCLVPCYDIFSEYYPDKKEEMRNVLEIAIFGMKDKTRDDYNKMMEVGKWLIKQIEQDYDRKE